MSKLEIEVADIVEAIQTLASDIEQQFAQQAAQIKELKEAIDDTYAEIVSQEVYDDDPDAPGLDD